VSVLLLLLLSFHQAPAGAGELYWPLGSGIDAYPLRATYGQLQGEEANVDLHFGLDVVAVEEAEAVYALEDGKVAKVYTDRGYYSGILIESDSGAALLYMHLEGSTIQFTQGDAVAVDDYLGDVVYVDDATGVRHLHLARLAETSHHWSDIDRFSSGNPLVLLDPALLDDGTAPEVMVLADGERFAVRMNEDSWNTESSDDYLDLDALVRGKLDVLARIREHDGTQDHDLAPYWMRLEIVPSTGDPLVFETTLDGSLKAYAGEERALFNLDDEHPSGDEGQYFVLTNGGAKPAIEGCWESETGQYTLRVTVRDVAGNEDSYERKVTVE
jgi:hypothetical protein